MQRDDTKNIFKAVEVIGAASSQLIKAIDGIKEVDERRAFRRKYAELIASIEQDFVFEVCVKYPQYADDKPK